MSLQFGYNYATIDPVTHKCIGFQSSSVELETSDTLVKVPVNDPEYMAKYYINGNWYEDAEGTIPWTSSLI